MIQLNLLPDVKLQYIKARQRKRMVISISAIAAIFFVSIFVVLFIFVRFAQQEHLSNLNTDIAAKTNELKSKQDIDKILTIQNQLNSLPALHDQKVIGSRLFDYLAQLTPTKATISDVDIAFKENTLTIKGNAEDLPTVNKFADTLKFTSYTANLADGAVQQCALGSIEQTGQDPSAVAPQTCRAFSEVVLKEFSISQNTSEGDKPIAYDLTFKFDPAIFANIKAAEGQKAVVLSVPKIITTRSVTEKPAALFAPQPIIEEGGAQ